MARLATIEDFRVYLKDDGGHADEQLLATMLDAASEQVEMYGERQFSPSDEVETRTVHVGGARFARLPDLRPDEDTVIVADGVTLASYRMLARRRHPAHAIVLYQDVVELQITGQWGFDPIPAGIRQATLQWAAKAWFARQARGADRVETTTSLSFFGRMPSAVRTAIDPYRVEGL